MKVWRIREEARDDIEDAARWYNDVREDLGEDFVKSAFEVIAVAHERRVRTTGKRDSERLLPRKLIEERGSPRAHGGSV